MSGNKPKGLKRTKQCVLFYTPQHDIEMLAQRAQQEHGTQKMASLSRTHTKTP